MHTSNLRYVIIEWTQTIPFYWTVSLDFYCYRTKNVVMGWIISRFLEKYHNMIDQDHTLWKIKMKSKVLYVILFRDIIQERQFRPYLILLCDIPQRSHLIVSYLRNIEPVRIIYIYIQDVLRIFLETSDFANVRS